MAVLWSFVHEEQGYEVHVSSLHSLILTQCGSLYQPLTSLSVSFFHKIILSYKALGEAHHF